MKRPRLRATWFGYIDPQEAYDEATHILDAMQQRSYRYLLNDNSRLSGPWFDSVEWLRRVWAPQAMQLGMRYIAHVVQPHDLLGEAAMSATHPFTKQLHLQFFDTVESAEEWLRAVRAGQPA
ncbi:hypothetical protein [Hymenobacter canadensis]|uniref:STAS/SEC14 domain-containing protein n=1 Tax=Hymenobacter canadensis TaxID=2999067 RepID=A0ABY7LLT1_9BACT|nr:hypothetical protein [Hymenobacter canadensis]WBA40754.1 hypothetical protein O3303_13090 [Hymenobacter canadensis]